MMVNRYDPDIRLDIEGREQAYMLECSDERGEYIYYSDYEELEAKNDKLKALLPESLELLDSVIEMEVDPWPYRQKVKALLGDGNG